MNPTHYEGEIVMAFGDPVKLTTPLGQVRLHSFISEKPTMELWLVEYLDQPEHFYEQWIPKNKAEWNGQGTADAS